MDETEPDEEILLDEEIVMDEDTSDLSLQAIDGMCGDNAKYNLSSDGKTLTISGKGAIWDNMIWPFKVSGNGIKIVIKSGITRIGDYAFSGLNPASVSIPSTVTAIGEYAFKSGFFTSITIPSGVEKLGDGAFYYCSNLKSITIPSKIKAIGSEMFYACYELTEVKLPSGLSSIEDRAFQRCGNLETISIPGSVTYLGDYAFNESGLKTISIPNKVTKIGEGAFYDCTNLKSVQLPSSLVDMGEKAFYGCSGLSEVAGNTTGWYTAIDRDAAAPLTAANLTDTYKFERLVKDNTNKCGDNLTYTFSNGTLTISGTGAMWDDMSWPFYYFNVTSKVIVNSGVTKIGRNAFCDMYMTEVQLPNTLKEIGEGAFYSADYLKEITIPDSVTTIGDDAFYYIYTLEKLTLSNNLKSIGDSAFSGCSKLSSVSLPSSLENLGDFAFSGCDSLTSINIPKSVKEISNGAFDGCSNLKSVTINEGILRIGDDAFCDCDSLTNVTVPGSVKEIGYRAFGLCENLCSITLNNGVEKIGDEFCEQNKKLVTVNLPNTLRHIGTLAFQDCTNLKNITIPASLQSMGNSAFIGCTYLRNNGGLDFGTGWKELDGKSVNPNETLLAGDWFPYMYRNMSASTTTEKARYKVTGSSDTHSYIGKSANPSTASIEDEVVEKSAYTFYVATDNKYKITKVTYQVDGKSPVTLSGSKGKYTIPSGKITADTTITVTSVADAFNLSGCSVTAQFYDSNGKLVNNSVAYDGAAANSYYGICADNIVIKKGKTVVTNLEQGVDYEVSYINNKAAGTAYIVLEGITEFCTGRKEQAFSIKGTMISDSKKVYIEYPKKVEWAAEDDPNCSLGSKIVVYSINPSDKSKTLLSENEDYLLVFSNNLKPGTATVTIIGINGYDGSKDIKITINKPNFAKAIEPADVDSIDDGEYRLMISGLYDVTYNGSKHTPEVEVTYGTSHAGSRLIIGKDYVVKYGSNINAGKGTVTVTGKGNYTGKITKTFTIEKKSIELEDVEISVPNGVYNKGKAVKPNPVVVLTTESGKKITLKKGKDYKVSYTNNTQEGEQGDVEIVGCGNYRGAQTATFIIVNRENDISKAFIFDTKSADAKEVLNREFTGDIQELSVGELSKIIKSKGTEGALIPDYAINYKVSYNKPVFDVGKYKLTFTGIGNCYGSKTVNLTVTPKLVETSAFPGVICVGDESIDDTTTSCENHFIYTGYPLKPDVIITDSCYQLKAGRDFTVSYKNNTNVGKGTVTIKFKGNYKAAKSRTIGFTIDPLVLSDDLDVSCKTAPVFLGGKEVKPALIIKCNGNTINPKAYKVTYDKNTDKTVGNSVAKIVPAKGTKDKNVKEGFSFIYNITPVELEDVDVSTIKAQIFKGKSVIPAFTIKYKGIKLVNGRDYEIYDCQTDTKGQCYILIKAMSDSGYEGYRTIYFVSK